MLEILTDNQQAAILLYQPQRLCTMLQKDEDIVFSIINIIAAKANHGEMVESLRWQKQILSWIYGSLDSDV